jgi:acetolactate synthase-1/2/3 large subunit
VARAAAHLAGAAAPVILAGGGAVRAEGALRAVAERLNAPVVQTANARGLMAGHALSVPASPSLAPVRALIAGADRVLAVGTEIGPTDYDMYALGGVPDLSGMVRVDVCADQLARHPAAVRVQGDAAAVLEALLPLLPQAAGEGAVRAAAARAAGRRARRSTRTCRRNSRSWRRSGMRCPGR